MGFSHGHKCPCGAPAPCDERMSARMCDRRTFCAEHQRTYSAHLAEGEESGGMDDGEGGRIGSARHLVRYTPAQAEARVREMIRATK